MKMVLGIFPGPYEAEHAIEELAARGYDPRDMSVVMKDRREVEVVSESTGTNAVAGDSIGNLVEALVGWGLSEQDARYYDDQITGGGILVVVPVRMDFEDEARSVLEEYESSQIRFADKGASQDFTEQSEYTPAYFHDVDAGEKNSRSAKKSRKSS